MIWSKEIAFGAALSFGLALVSTSASAATVLSADNGWYISSGTFHAPGHANTLTGAIGTDVYRSFYLFDLAGQLKANTASITFFAPNGYFLTDIGAETIELFDYTGSIDALVGGGGDTIGEPIFNDLGSGISFGRATITAPNMSLMPQFTVILPKTFIEQFNRTVTSEDRRVAIGAALQTQSTRNQMEGFWGGSDLLPAAQLNIGAVPEPSTWALMLLGFGFVGGAMRTAKRRQSLAISYVR